jgi:hypothetical protein
MSTSAVPLRVLRLLGIASGLLCVCVVAALLSASAALAHAGHRHAPDVQVVLLVQPAETLQLVTSIATITVPDVAAGAPSRVGNSRHAGQTGQYEIVSFAEISDAMTGASHARLAARCACGSGCGSCTSVSCCFAALAPGWVNQFGRPEASVPVLPISARMASTGVAPLQRPPNPHLLA